MSRLREHARLVLYTTAWWAVQTMPEPAAYALFRAVADLAWRRRSPSVRGLERNLARVGPRSEAELRELSRAGIRSYLRYWCDAFRMSQWSPERIVGKVRTVNEHLLHEGLAEGRGVVVPLPHMANWDLAGAWACLEGMPVVAVAERVRPERLFQKFLDYRQSLGMTVVAVGDEDVMGTLAGHLREGRLVCLPAERDLSHRGVPVTLFGERTRMPAGSAMLARRTGAVLLPVTLHYEGKEPEHQLVVTFHDRIEVPGRPGWLATTTQQIATVFEKAIAAHPEDWHMTQRMFLSDLPAGDTRRAEPVVT